MKQRCLSLLKPIAAAVALSSTATAQSAQEELEEIIITAVRTEYPLHLKTDPRQARQPLPTNDGADYLKTIPGFSVIRKGGSAGDAVLRGMAGSRVSMLLNGEVLLGGCNNRMDPPTSYIFPETLDVIEVIKGPQSVQHGPGNSAGVVLFERDTSRPEEAGWSGHSSLLSASDGRVDGMLDVQYSTRDITLSVAGSSASADNYHDGDNTEVHSEYKRWNTDTELAWTPDDNTRLSFSAGLSDGEAAYADRGVDGSRYAREHYSLHFEKSGLAGLVSGYELQAYWNEVDHVMDNYSLREPSGMMSQRMAMNPSRETSGSRAVLNLVPVETLTVLLGLDSQRNSHQNRNSMNQDMLDYRDIERQKDARFDQWGVFSETRWQPEPGKRWLAGVRWDDWQVRDQRDVISLSMMNSATNPSADKSRQESLRSGFLRYEQDVVNPGSAKATFYAGLGHSERFPDYWEIIARETEDSLSALAVEPEKTTQLDIGLLYSDDRLSASVSVFYNEVKDYLLIQNGFEKTTMSMGSMAMSAMSMPAEGMTNTRTSSIVRNIDARSWGGEVDMDYRLLDNWRVGASLASVRGANDTDDRTLAQLPPLELRVSLGYERDDWSAGMLWRALAEQDRVDLGVGNIVGQDFGPTDSAQVLSLNAAWRMREGLLLSAGIDNLLDETYAEHISRAGASVLGFEQLQRVNEPGRTLWMKASFSF